ncbi:putative methyltransferase-domain-containing protein [Neurospora tetraspora]|uniref:Methyltransferase-domain-containing protein n=1 Tax=Neurospora tetraspora TaxID=94610 RepID=A0AAE0JM19_9PEZI|nr:putative methyltransferase-domain-containing protein [Neurospora tetraspora]
MARTTQIKRKHMQIARFCRQYLQLAPVVDFPDGEYLCDASVQETLYEQLFSEDMENPAPPRYQLRILKELVKRIEGSIEDWDRYGLSDNLYTRLSHLLSLRLPSEADAAQQKCYVTYHLSLLGAGSAHDQTLPVLGDKAPHITLLESRNLIAASGTTGLRTWEASLHLGQYLLTHPSLVRDKRVLELGAGTGYVSILCAKYLGSKHVMATDGSDEVVANLPDSLFLNGLQGSDSVQPMELWWGHALVGTEEEQWNGGREVDVVLGADITYDKSVIPALVATVEEVLGLFPKAEVVIAATERNRETYESFLSVCEGRGLEVVHAEFPVPPRSEQTGPFYNDLMPIHICQLRRM